MKKLIFCTAVVLLLFAIGGCRSTEQTENEKLLERIEELEEELDALADRSSDTRQSETLDQSETHSDQSANGGLESQNIDGQEQDSASQEEDIAGIAERITALAAEIEEGSEQDYAYEEYLQLKRRLEDCDDQLDLKEDVLENEFKNSRMTRNEYLSQMKEIESLEWEIERLEELLERLYGIDD